MALTQHELRLLREAVSSLQTVRRVEDLEIPSIRRLRAIEDFLRALHNTHTKES